MSETPKMNGQTAVSGAKPGMLARLKALLSRGTDEPQPEPTTVSTPEEAEKPRPEPAVVEAAQPEPKPAAEPQGENPPREVRLRRFIEHAPMAYALLDERGIIVECNPAFCRMTAMASQTLCGRSLSSLISPEQETYFSMVLAELLGKGGERSLETELVRSDRALLSTIVEFSVEPRSTDGQSHAHCVVFDITERKNFEKALRVSEERLNKALEIANDGIWDLDLRTGEGYLSHRYYSMLGFAQAEFSSGFEHWRVLIHPDDYPGAEQTFNDFLSSKQLTFTHEHRMRMRDGEWRWILCAGRAWELDTEGRKLRVIGTISDITERKQAQEALLETASRYRSYITESPLAIVATDSEGLITEANPASCVLFGCSFEQLKATSVVSLLDEGSVEIGRRLLRQIVKANRGEGDLRARRKNGALLELQVLGATVAPSGLMLFIRDVTSRRRAEQMLRVREAMLEGILHTALHGLWIIDLQGHLIEVNDSYCRLSGYSHKELMQMRVSDLDCVETSQSISEHIERIRRIGQDRWESRHRRKDGDFIDVEISSSFLPEEGGRIVVFLQDITERKRSEHALRQSQRRLSLIVEGSSLAAWDWDIAEDTIVYNRYWAELLGFELEEPKLSIKEWAALIHPDDIGATGRAMTLHLEGKVPRFDAEYRVRTAKGGWLWLMDRGQVISRDRNGKPLRATGTQIDVTLRHAAEEQVRRQAALLDLTQELIFTTDIEGTIRYCNRSAQEILGLGPRRVEGLTLEHILPDAIPLPGPELLRQVLAEGFWDGELGFGPGIRHGRVWETRVSVVSSSPDKERSLLVVISDVTDKRLLESRFLRAQRMESIGSLASGVAHDLNNIFLPITLSATMLRKDCSEEQRQVLFSMLDESSKRGAEIVRQLLTFGRGLDGQRVEIQPRMLLLEMRKIIKETFPKSITLRCDLAEDLWTISADPTQMHQVLLNLCVNARDAMSEAGGVLTLSGENILFDEHYVTMNPDAQPGPYIVLLVGDTGSGISPDILEKIFDPFFTTKEAGKGTGLGLSTVHGIVKSHSGFVQVRSHVGQGSLFKVYLPAIPTPITVTEEPPDEEVPQANGELILVVDDEEAIRESLRHLLETNGYRVIVAGDGSQGMVCFVQQQQNIRALVTDIMMPLMDGAELIRAVRRLSPKLPILAMSGLPEKEQQIERPDTKADYFLIKPFVSDQLLVALHRCLGPGTSQNRSLDELLSAVQSTEEQVP